MKNSVIGVIVLSAILALGCSKMFYTASGGVRPKRKNFYFSNGQLSIETNSKIDTNFLYLNTIKNMYAGAGKSGNLYKYYRFYKNSRFQMSTSYIDQDDYPEFQNINTGYIGYYKVKNDTLLCEFFASTNGGEYIFMEGLVENDMIILKKMYPRNNAYSNKKNDTLVKTAIKAIHLKPDW